MKTIIILIIFFLFPILLFSQAQKMEINWGDGSEPMILDKNFTYQEMIITSDAGSQKIYYHSSWMKNGNLIHWLDKNKKPEHRFKTSGKYSVKITEKNASNNVLNSNTSSITIPSQNLDDIPDASTAGIKEPFINDPLIEHVAGQNYVFPGANNYFEASYSFLAGRITDQKNYIIKNVIWEFKAPWMKNWEYVMGFKVLYNKFLVPSSSLDVTKISNDPFKNLANYKLIYCYTGNQIGNNSVKTASGMSVTANTYLDYYSQPKNQIIVPVADIIPPNKDPSVLPPDYFETNFPDNADYKYTTGGKFPPASFLQVKDENPNLNPDNLACTMILLGENDDPYDVSKHIVSRKLKKPNKFARFPNSTTPPPVKNTDFYSLSRWETDKIKKLTIPFIFKGNTKLAGKVTGFGPGEPYVTCKQFIIIDDDKPNIFVRFYDLFNGKIRNEHWVTDSSIPSDKTKPDPIDTGSGLIEYKYDFFNDLQKWSNKVENGIVFEDTRTFIELYIVDNVSNISGKAIQKFKHLHTVSYNIENKGTGKKVVSGTYDSSSITSEKIPLPSVIFSSPGKFKISITAEDNATQDENDNFAFNSAVKNVREFNLIVNVTDIQQKTNIINSSSNRRRK
ncbi:hypothetical protein KAJ27_06660 [bacterium]|nr:hypothetical protein [bacterium]